MIHRRLDKRVIMPGSHNTFLNRKLLSSDTSDAFLFFSNQFLNLVQLLARFAFLALLQGDAISTLKHTQAYFKTASKIRNYSDLDF